MPEVQVTMDCLEGVWEPLGDGLRCRFSGMVHLMQSSLVDPARPHRVLVALLVWEQPTPDVFGHDESTPSVEIPHVGIWEDVPLEVQESISEGDMVNGPARTVTSESPSDRSSTAFSAVKAVEGQVDRPGLSRVDGSVSSSVSTRSTDGPSEGGIHG